MPIVRIDMWTGRTRDEKNALIRNVTDAVVDAIGCPEQAVEVLLNEVDKADWATGGVCHADRPPLGPPA
jgi:4-oxalocrotonate tautomerase